MFYIPSKQIEITSILQIRFEILKLKSAILKYFEILPLHISIHLAILFFLRLASASMALKNNEKARNS